MTLHLTGCWYPGVDEKTLDSLSYALRVGDLRLVERNDTDVPSVLNTLCADALERMAGTLEETT